MLLYDGGRVPNARRVRIFLAEKAMKMPISTVDLGKNDHKTAEYRRLNPLQRVPALVLDDGSVLTESIAICRYIEAIEPHPPLFGKNAHEQAFIEMWQRRLELELFLPIAQSFRHLHPAMAGYEEPQVPEWGRANAERAVAYMHILEGDIGEKSFVYGDAFSVADITALVALDFTRAAKIEIPAGCTNLRRWHAELGARPSAKA